MRQIIQRVVSESGSVHVIEDTMTPVFENGEIIEHKNPFNGQQQLVVRDENGNDITRRVDELEHEIEETDGPERDRPEAEDILGTLEIGPDDKVKFKDGKRPSQSKQISTKRTAINNRAST